MAIVVRMIRAFRPSPRPDFRPARRPALFLPAALAALCLLPGLSCARAPRDTAPASAATSPASSDTAVTAPAAPATPSPDGFEYVSRHGFAFRYPPGFFVFSPMDVEPELEKAIQMGSNYFQVLSYDPARVTDPGAPPSPDVLKMDVRVGRPCHASYDAWLKDLPDVREARDVATGAGPGKIVVNEEFSEESQAHCAVRRGLLLTRGLQVEFICPGDTRRVKEFERIVSSFRLTR